jgi:hypothetical protein
MRTVATIAMLLLTVAVARAQAPPANPVPAAGPQATVRCAPVPPPPAAGNEKEDRSQQTVGQSRESLSDRLAQGSGVLCPPGNVDPEMQKPPPEEGKTPVIPPPGSPGGDPTVRPK